MSDRIEEIFHAARALTHEERAAFLAQACGNNETLRNEVESLLECAEQTKSPLKSSAVPQIFRFLFQEDGESLVGKTLGHYQILSSIGEGGNGEVYEAIDLRLNRKIALKSLPAYLIKNEEQVRRLHHEARAASALNHPNIVTIYELGQEDSLHFIAMERIEGETLRQKHLPLSFSEVLSIGIQVASGLSAAHHAGILHRDIKPENIMAAKDGGFIKILDFGISKFKEQPVVSGAVSLSNAETTFTAGTLSYMSPEQARGEPLDARTDIFSLGVLLFELVAGERPFSGQGETEILRALLSDREAPSLRNLRDNVPADLERIISKALKKKKEERYQSAADMLADLREFDRVVGSELDDTQRANRMLRQYLSIYAADKRALIPLAKLRYIRRHSDLERGKRARELLGRSLRVGATKVGASVLSVAALATLVTAYYSISERWDEVVLKDGHTRAVRQAAFSPDGRLLVSAGEDGKVIVWDFAKRMPLATFIAHTRIATSVAFSPDGKWFASGGEDGKINVWSAANLAKEAALEQPGKVISVAFSNDSHVLASAAFESFPEHGRIVLWSAGDWRKTREFSALLGDYGPITFERGSNYLVSNRPQKWDIETGRELKADIVYGMNWIALAPDQTGIVMLDGGGIVQYLRLSDHKVTEYSDAHQDSGRTAAYSPDGKYLATGSDDVVLWDAATMTKLARFEYDAVVWNVSFSPDGRWLVSTHGDGAIVVWDVKDRKRVANLNGQAAAVRGVAWSPDGKQIASASEDESVIIWNADTRQKQSVLLGPASRLTGVAFSRNGKQVGATGFNRELITWDLTEQRPHSYDVHNATYCIAYSADDRWIATTTGVYDAADGHLIIDFSTIVGKEATQMYGVAFSDDGRWLVGVSPARYLSLLETGTWRLVNKIKLDSQLITVSFSPDSKRLVTGEDEGAIRLWDVEPLRQIGVIGRHSSRIKSVAFSPSGREVCSAGDDQMIALWDVNARRLITKIGTHARPVLAVAFSPDGKRIASGEHDSSVRIYTRHSTLWGWQLN
jgi:WD40 repeat protein/serine/threonine protein kinase